jgi:saccharopine dehydrogenase-like NADP-dependent oxidoreductase
MLTMTILIWILTIASMSSSSSSVLALSNTKNVLVVGGSGRVGGSTVRWLRTFSDRDTNLNLNLKVGCRTRESFDKARRNKVIPDDDDDENTNNDGHNVVGFVPVDLDGPVEDIKSAVRGCDLVVHTAGPFQGRTDPVLLKCCIDEKVPFYVDVCDEYELAVAAKELVKSNEKEDAHKITAVVSSGIWPGVSALMAAEAKSKLETRYGEVCDTLDLSFFTAGTGNAGPTILSATFLLLATPVLNYLNGKPVTKQPWTEEQDVDFGSAVGTKRVWLLDNPDVPTTADSLNVLNVSSRFGTDPLFWNYLFYLIRAIPTSILKNRDAMQALALFSEPIVRLVDKLVGSTNAMRVDAKSSSGNHVVTSTMVHPDLESCVGLATAAFCLEVLKGTTTTTSKDDGGDATIPPGIWYPAELPPTARANILEVAREDTLTYEV